VMTKTNESIHLDTEWNSDHFRFDAWNTKESSSNLEQF
jgi:hypothetical protein